MSAKLRLLVPYGLKTLMEGLSRAVVSAQPTNIAHYASFYFTELLQYRHENPSMDFKDLVQEFQHRQENAQIQYDPVENSKSEISDILLPKDKAGSAMVETEKEQRTAEQDPRAGNTSIANAMPAVLNGDPKYPSLHCDVSNPLVSAHRVHSQLHPEKEPAVAERKDSVKYQPQEQTSLGVDVSSEQSAKEPEKLDKVSSIKQSQPTKTLEKKGSLNGTVPNMSDDQVVYPTNQGQDLDQQYPLPQSVPSHGRRTDGATPSFSALIPERIISKPQNLVKLPGDVQRIISSMSQHPPDQAHLSPPGSAFYLAKQTVESWPPVPPTQGVEQLKITSGPTENQQRTEVPSSNFYQINISVDKPVSKVCYEPAYIPGKDASMVHIVTAVPASRISTTVVSSLTTSVHYEAAPKPTPLENIQTPTVVQCRRPQYGCLRPLPPHLQQLTYRKTESSKYYAPYVQKKSNSPEAITKQGYKDASSQSSASELNQACSDSVQRNLIGSPGENEQANLRTLYQQSVNSQHQTEQPPSQRLKYMKFLPCPCMSDPPSSNVQSMLITSPAYVVSDEAKRFASSSYNLVGSTKCKTEQSKNEQDFQKFTTTPAPFASTKPNTGNEMQDLIFQHDPEYVSVTGPVEQVQRSATPSITHLAETRSIPSFAGHRSATAIAVAVTRCPSVTDGLDQEQGSKAAQDDEGDIRPIKTEYTTPY